MFTCNYIIKKIFGLLILILFLFILFSYLFLYNPFIKIKEESKKLSFSQYNEVFDTFRYYIKFNSKSKGIYVPGYGDLNNYDFHKIGPPKPRCQAIQNFNSIKKIINKKTDIVKIYFIFMILIYIIVLVLLFGLFYKCYYNNKDKIEINNNKYIIFCTLIVIILTIIFTIIIIVSNNIKNQTSNFNKIDINNKLRNPDCEE